MAKFSYQEKLEAVLRVVEEGMSPRDSAHILETDRSCVKKWIDLYKNFGVEGLLLKNGFYTGDFKLSVVRYMHTNQLSIRETAAKFGIPSYTTVGNWERIYYREGPQGFNKDNRGRKSKMSSSKSKNKKIDNQLEEDLIAEVQRLRMENEYLKKLQALVQERIARENGNEPSSSMN